MKKLLTLIPMMAIMLSSNTAQAQKPYAGLLLGADFQHASGASLKKKFNGYFLGGISGGIAIKKFTLQADFIYTQTTLTTGDNFGNALGNYIKNTAISAKDNDFKLSELSIPVTLSYKVLDRLTLGAGVQYSIIANVKDQKNILTSTKEVFRGGYASLVAVARVRVLRKLYVDGRFVQGIQSVQKNDVPERWAAGRFQLGIGYRLL